MNKLINEDTAVILTQSLKNSFNLTLIEANKYIVKIPGAKIFLKYLKSSYQNDPYRVFFELALFFFLIWYFNHEKKKLTDKQKVVLTEKEIDELCQEWEPEPLVPDLTEFQKEELRKTIVISGQTSTKVKIQGDAKEKFNLASFDFLSILNRESTKEKTIEALRKYGVGTCGPRGFYGTIDVHLELEQKLAKFVKTDGAAIYSQNFSTVSSAIPAFAKRGDTIVADDGSNLAIQVGNSISRSNLHLFKHNDMKDLERVLEDLKKKEQKKKSKTITRKFIVVEGLYMNSGDIAPLPDLVRLKKKYKCRLIVEESLSFGVLGKTGAGLAEHFNLPAQEVDIMVGSLTNSIGSSGGFVAGSKEVCEQQVLSGQAYTFSASLPAMLTVGALEALKILELEGEKLLVDLKENIKIFWDTFTNKKFNLESKVEIFGGLKDPNVFSPVIFFRLKKVSKNRESDEKVLQEICDLSLKDGVLVTRVSFCQKQEKTLLPPTVRVVLCAGLSRKESEKCAYILREAILKNTK
ncbi:serine palmitoyltransferase component [Clydaea vesicula]|uniref:serine C-palmitoyltransferase n=1 Tax=Clydaea vesicula TaxID=447962 RepID=A0AAD5TX54_9FUNG|nr:serine palmitoyltransferase component [Clydaea vesicula]KAJ3380927.1 serine palmitoyltransferase component [Lobulomyces angularis]